MPSLLHEVIVEIFRSQPRLAPELLRNVFRFDLPSFQEVIIGEGDLTTLAPTSYLSDLVVLLRRHDAVFSIVVEVQLSIDKDNPAAWIVYLANLYAKTEAPVALLIIAPDERVAEWCEGPFSYGQPGLYLSHVGARPEARPHRHGGRGGTRAPGAACLSALVHSQSDAAYAVGKGALRAAMQLDVDRRRICIDLILSKSSAKQRLLEELMVLPKDYEYQTPELRELHEKGWALGFEQGHAEGRAEALFGILQARGFVLAKETRARIGSCRDLQALDAWIRRAAVAASVDEIFEAEPAS